MIVYSHNYVTLADVCKHNSLDYTNVMDAICNSHISFGTNEDTLVSQSTLEDILETRLDWARMDDTVLISLGS
jgi:hypothetical protein